MKKVKKISITLLIVLSILQSMITPVFAAQFSDIRGHWAENQINSWISKNLIKGYSNGTFKPNNEISRAEFMSLVNRAFGFLKTASIEEFGDVSPEDWFFQDVAKASAQGYISGFDGYVRPKEPITRQEVSVVLGKILKLKEQVTSAYKFKDNIDMAEWGIGYIGAISYLGYINGYSDKTFKPDNYATRAEVIAILHKAVGTLYNTPGNYGPESGFTSINGNVTINKPDVNFKRITISGNLYITEGVGTGSVTLENVTVYGTTTISGGGLNSVKLLSSSLGKVVINSPDSTDVRVSAEGSTTITSIEVQTSAHLEENNLMGQGFSDVKIDIPAWNSVQLAGNYNKIDIYSEQSLVHVVSGTVIELNVTQYAKGTQANIYPNAIIKTLNLNEATIIYGTGTIETANIKTNGSSISKKPNTVILSTGVSASIAGVSSSTTVWMSSISDQTCAVGSTINLSQYFTPDSATRTISSNNTTVASAKLAGNTITITGRAVGTAKITVKAAYSGYSSTSQSFNVTVTAVTGVLYSVAQTIPGSVGTGQINKITVQAGARLGATEVKKIAVGSGAGLLVSTTGAINFTLSDSSTAPAVSVSYTAAAGETNSAVATYLIGEIKNNSNFINYYNSFNLTAEGNIIVLSSKSKLTDRNAIMTITDTDITGVGNSSSYTVVLGAAPGDGNISFQVSDGIINQIVTVTIGDGNSSSTIAQKIVAAVNADANKSIVNAYTLSIESGSIIVLTSITNFTNKVVTLNIIDTGNTGTGTVTASAANSSGNLAVQEVNTLTILHDVTRSGILKCTFSDGNISHTELVHVFAGNTIQTVAYEIYYAFRNRVSGYTVSFPTNETIRFTKNVGEADRNVVITIY